MNDDRKVADEQQVLDALEQGISLHQEQVDLAKLARFSRQQAEELQSYDRKWSHPLGLVISD